LTVLDQVKSWLEKGVEEPKEIAELPWEIEEVKENGTKGLIAVNPKLPVKLFVVEHKEVNILRVLVQTGIYTADLEPSEKLRVYRNLLSLNKNPLAKIFIDGMDGEIVAAADLSTKTMGEEEFHDTISFTITLVISLYNKYGVPKNVQLEMLSNLVWLIQKRIEKGWTRDKLEAFLVNKVGMGKSEADQLLETVFPSKEKKQVETKGAEQIYM
jgi:hypothetical protein